MQMKAAVMRVQGKHRPYADSHPMTIETVDLDPPGPGAVDLNADKLRLARELGATDTFLAGNADVVAEIRSATDGGLDYVIETAGAIPAMNLAYAIAARGGMIVSAGLSAVSATFAFPHSALVIDEKTIRGSYMGSCVPKRAIPRFIALYQRGRLPVQKLRSGFVTFEQINEGFELMRRGESIRTVVTY